MKCVRLVGYTKMIELVPRKWDYTALVKEVNATSHSWLFQLRHQVRFTSADVANKISLLPFAKPSVLQKNKLSSCQMVQDCFELESYKRTSILYLKGKNDWISIVVSIEKLHKTLDSLHSLEGYFISLTKLYNLAALKHHAVIEKMCRLLWELARNTI